MAGICDDERASYGVMSGHDRRTLSLSDAFLLHQPAHVLGGDDLGARGQQREAGLRPHRGRWRQLAGLDARPRQPREGLAGSMEDDANQSLRVDAQVETLNPVKARDEIQVE
jgi:hypothetical protein